MNDWTLEHLRRPAIEVELSTYVLEGGEERLVGRSTIRQGKRRGARVERQTFATPVSNFTIEGITHGGAEADEVLSTFDENDRLREVVLRRRGERVTSLAFQYDDRGRKTQVVEAPVDERPAFSVTYTYDGDRLRTEVTACGGVLLSEKELVYDEAGLVISIVVRDGERESVERFEYEFNDAGDWITRTGSHSRVRRRITYA